MVDTCSQKTTNTIHWDKMSPDLLPNVMFNRMEHYLIKQEHLFDVSDTPWNKYSKYVKQKTISFFIIRQSHKHS